MKLQLAALLATSGIAIVAAVFAIWPVVSDAPWEDTDTTAIRCEGALDFRELIVDAGEYRAGLLPIGVAQNPDGIEDYDAQLAKAEREISQYC